MKNKNKGFTLIEVLVVVALLAIIATLATVSILKYREDVKQKEKVTVRSSLKSSFDSYRIKNNANKQQKVNLSQLNLESKLSYNGNKCSNTDLSESYIFYIVKGDKLPFLSGDDVIKACILETKVEEDTTVEGKKAAVVSCLKDEAGNPIPSKEEEYCVYFKCNGQEIINDIRDTSSLCSK